MNQLPDKSVDEIQQIEGLEPGEGLVYIKAVFIKPESVNAAKGGARQVVDEAAGFLFVGNVNEIVERFKQGIEVSKATYLRLVHGE